MNNTQENERQAEEKDQMFGDDEHQNATEPTQQSDARLQHEQHSPELYEPMGPNETDQSQRSDTEKEQIMSDSWLDDEDL